MLHYLLWLTASRGKPRHVLAAVGQAIVDQLYYGRAEHIWTLVQQRESFRRSSDFRLREHISFNYDRRRRAAWRFRLFLGLVPVATFWHYCPRSGETKQSYS